MGVRQRASSARARLATSPAAFAYRDGGRVVLHPAVAPCYAPSPPPSV